MMRNCRFVFAGVALVFCAMWNACVATAEENSVSLSQEEVAHRLSEIADGLRGTLGYSICELSGEPLFSQNADEQFPQASAIKVPLLMEVLKQREEGKLRWEDRHLIEKEKQVGGSGVLLELADRGSELCVGDLCVLMILLSDNTATNMLIDLVGMESVNETMSSLGFHHTKLQRLMMDIAASERGEENLSTPAEASQIMQLLGSGKFLSQEVSDEALDILRRAKSTSIREGVPQEVPVVTKPGGIPRVATEWAIVELPERPYIIVLMGKEGRTSRFREAFTEMTKVVHDYMSQVVNSQD